MSGKLHPRLTASDDEVTEIISQLQTAKKQKVTKDHLDDQYLCDTIRKLDSGKYQLVSGDGKNLGIFDTLAEAEKHERRVQYFKHRDD